MLAGADESGDDRREQHDRQRAEQHQFAAAERREAENGLRILRQHDRRAEQRRGDTGGQDARRRRPCDSAARASSTIGFFVPKSSHHTNAMTPATASTAHVMMRAAIEPVAPFAFFEHELQRAEREREQPDAGDVDAAPVRDRSDCAASLRRRSRRSRPARG